jgi:hypothetical protein
MRFIVQGLALAVTSALSLTTAAQQPGDIAIIGLYSDAPDKIAFVALADIPGGTSINFTDEGWKASGGFLSGENVLTWTAPTGGVAAGTVVSLDFSGISNDGDQIIAFAGAYGSPTPLLAVNDEGTAWQSDALDNYTSALPAGLTNGSTAVALNELDNYAYSGPTSGTKAELLAAIADKSQWTGSNSNFPLWPTAFTVTDASTGGTGTTPTPVLASSTYTYTADGSAGVWAGDHFINFDDETNIARLYKAGVSSSPITSWNLTKNLALRNEADFEDAARIGNDVLLITSHARNKDGVYESDRYRLARLTVNGSGASTSLSVAGYTKTLVQNIVDSTKWKQPDAEVINLIKQRTQLGTTTVPNLAPKVDGFNIEGIGQLPGTTARVAIGLRNPLINNQAIVITLENPLDAATGKTPVFGQAIRLDLGGLGIRAMTWSATDNMMYIVAGHTTSESGFYLYRWNGQPGAAAEYLMPVSYSGGGSIEAILPHEGTNTLRLLVDEGAVLINGTENKALPTAEQRFHDVLVNTN